jgi:hypothetical protein
MFRNVLPSSLTFAPVLALCPRLLFWPLQVASCSMEQASPQALSASSTARCSFLLSNISQTCQGMDKVAFLSLPLSRSIRYSDMLLGILFRHLTVHHIAWRNKSCNKLSQMANMMAEFEHHAVQEEKRDLPRLEQVIANHPKRKFA